MRDLTHPRVLVAGGQAPVMRADGSGPTRPVKVVQLTERHHRDQSSSKDGPKTAESEPWREAMKEAENKALGRLPLIAVTQCGDDLHVIRPLVTRHFSRADLVCLRAAGDPFFFFFLWLPIRLTQLIWLLCPPVRAGAQQQTE